METTTMPTYFVFNVTLRGKRRIALVSEERRPGMRSLPDGREVPRVEGLTLQGAKEIVSRFYGGTSVDGVAFGSEGKIGRVMHMNFEARADGTLQRVVVCSSAAQQLAGDEDVQQLYLRMQSVFEDLWLKDRALVLSRAQTVVRGFAGDMMPGGARALIYSLSDPADILDYRTPTETREAVLARRAAVEAAFEAGVAEARALRRPMLRRQEESAAAEAVAFAPRITDEDMADIGDCLSGAARLMRAAMQVMNAPLLITTPVSGRPEDLVRLRDEQELEDRLLAERAANKPDDAAPSGGPPPPPSC